jgi:hypothetical protein
MRGESISIDDFTPSDMQLLLQVIGRVCTFLKLTDSDEHLSLKARVTASVVKCAEDGERNAEKLFHCARVDFAKGNGQ